MKISQELSGKFFFNVRDFGAAGSGRQDDTAAIRKAIEACKAQGGTVYFPPGIYLSSALQLVSRLCLYLDAGAVLRFSDDFHDYPPVPTRWEGVECYGFSPLIYGNGLEDVHITGYGVIDGQGAAWWQAHEQKIRQGITTPVTALEKKLAELNQGYTGSGSGGGGREMQFLRPPLLQLFNCRNLSLEGITLQNSPFWNTHLVYCDNVSISHVTFKNPPAAPNTDGLDLDSCCHVRVTGCHFDVGDDCLCLKSGMDADGRRVGRPTENITITNCTMRQGHGGVVFGSEAAAGIRRVVVSNCIFDGTDRGIRIKSRRGRGGVIEDLQFSQILMHNVLCPFVMNLFYRCGTSPHGHDLFSLQPQPVSEKTPAIRNISLAQITARNVGAAAGFFHGLPESPIENIQLSALTLSMNLEPGNPGGHPGMVHGLRLMKGEGFYCRYTKGLSLENVRLITDRTTGMDAEDCTALDVQGLKLQPPSPVFPHPGTD